MFARRKSVSNSSIASATIRVVVEDRNDNAPVFSEEKYETFLPEDSLGGTTVVTVSATDADTGIFGTEGIKYYLYGNGANRYNCIT